MKSVDAQQLEQRLFESEERYRIFTELTSDFCYVCSRTLDGTFKLQWFGGQFERITGYSNQELHDIGCWMPMVHPNDSDRVAAGLLALGAGDSAVTEFRLIRKDQSIIWIRKHSRCIQDSINPNKLLLYGSARDITATKENSAALQAAESAYRTIFNATNDAIFIMEPSQGMILDCNKQATHMFDRPREALVGATPVQMSPDDPSFGPERAQQIIQTVNEGTPQLFEWHCIRPDASTFWTEVSLRATEINGRQRLLAVVRDISERKQAMQELQLTRDAAQAATIAKNEFLANMSHEVRTPLNGIMGISQLLRTTDLTVEQQGYMDMLDSSARNLLVLINDILDISRIEAGRMVIEQTAFSPAKVLREISSIFAAPAAEKGISLEMQPADELPTALVGDPLRLKQVLVNLVGNAIKFTSQGTIALTARLLEPDSQGIRVCFEVADSGVGMSAETLQNIFLTFTQADASTARMHGGSGLGLAICRRLAELMGGCIKAESSLGQGSRFLVELPFGHYTGQEPAISPESGLVATALLQPVQILLVEDQEINRTFVQRLLERQGHLVTGAVDGLMALDYLKRSRYDLMLLDIQMPGMGGEELLALLRQEERTTGAHLPVIALTAHALTGDREKLMAVGFDGYVAKPVQMDLLINEMSRTLELKDTGGAVL